MEVIYRDNMRYPAYNRVLEVRQHDHKRTFYEVDLDTGRKFRISKDTAEKLTTDPFKHLRWCLKHSRIKKTRRLRNILR